MHICVHTHTYIYMYKQKMHDINLIENVYRNASNQN